MTETPPPMPQKISRYEIRSEIGRGGMATVYLAYDPNFGREVAIKILPHELMHDPSFRTRFQREARTIAALEHPAIVPVYDFGEENGQPFLVMRYLSGGSLVSRIRAGPIAAAEAARILIRIGSALDAAHAKGVVHRDLKPANILFDQYGDAYLGDFGIAQLSESGGTLTGQMVLGTPAYMSPEQIRGEKKVDGRSDIYALGIVMFEMLTGKAPFEADSPVKMMMMHLSTPPPRVPETAVHLPHGSSEVIERALAKEPDDRYQKAADFGRAFESIATGEHPARVEIPAEDVDRPAGMPSAAPGVKPARPFVPGWTSELSEKPVRRKLWAALAGIAAVALCICLAAGGGGTLLALSDWGKSFFGFPAPPTATATLTATLAQTHTPTCTLTPSTVPAAPTPTIPPYAPGEPYRLTDGKGISSQPNLAVDSEGVTHVFWMDKTEPLNGKILHRALSPEGIWTDPDCVTCLAGDPKYLYDYKFTARENGEVCAGFAHSPKYEYVASVACYRGAGPAEYQEIEMPGSEIDFLLALDPSGILVAPLLTTKSIRVGGQTLTDDSLSMFAQTFGIDSEGGFHLLWIRDSDPPVLVHLYSPDGGTKWSAPVEVLGDVHISDELVFLAGRSGEMYLLVDGLIVRTLRWKGSWSEVHTLSGDFIPYSFAAANDPDGKVLLFSTAWFDGKEGIWLAQWDDPSGAWSEPVLLLGMARMTMAGLSAAAGPDGKILLAYGQSSDDVLQGEIYFLSTTLPKPR